MKIEILKENLKNGLGATERIVGKNISLPILNNILLTTDDTYLNIVSTDLEVAIKVWVLGKIINKGSLVVPAKLLSSFISTLPNDKVAIEAKNQNIHIECRNIKTQIQGANPEEFPIIPEFNNTEYIEIDAVGISQGLSCVVDITSSSSNRPEISGVYFSFSKNSLKMVATDSFRLGEKIVQLPSTAKKDYSFILPQKSAKELIHILEGRQGLIKVYFSANQVLFEVPMKQIDRPEAQITSRLIDGEYPNYQDIIPTKFKTQVTIKKDEFLSHIKTASLFSGKVNEVKLSFDKEQQILEISAKSQDLGENISQLPVKIEGESIAVSFNYKYLLDGLLYVKSSEVVFDISKEEGPCILRPVGDSSYIYMAMPIKSL